MSSTQSHRPLFANDERIAVRTIREIVPLLGRQDGGLVLPPIQRGSVWEPRKVVELWDSVLRGLPIGSFLAYRMGAGTLARAIKTNQGGEATEPLTSEAFALFDGQQRMKALLRGRSVSKNDDLCVWVDLGQASKDGAAFRMRVTTVGRPFGYPKDFAGNWSVADLRKAVEAYRTWRTSEGNQDEVRLLNLFRDATQRPAPWHSSRFVLPLHELVDLCVSGNTSPTELEKAVAPWRRSLVDDVPAEFEAEGDPHDRFIAFHEALNRALDLPVAIQLVDEDVIGTPTGPEASEIEDDANAKAERAKRGEALTDLFQRIGQNGSRLTDGDLAFSMIKQSYPWAHDAVQAIHRGTGDGQQTPVGAMLDQTEIVLLALRVARMVNALDKSDDGRARINVTTPGPRDVGELKADPTFRTLLPEQGQDGSRSLSSLLCALVDTLSHKGEDDTGLPRPSFAFLDFDLISILTLWAFQAGEGENAADRIQNSRAELLRFVLWWRLAVFDRPRAGRVALEWMSGEADGASASVFPGHALYWRLIDTRSDKSEWVGLPTPQALPFACANIERRKALWEGMPRDTGHFFDPNTAWLRAEWERFGHPDDVRSAITKNGEAGATGYARYKPEHDRVVADTFWHAVRNRREDILIWLQRAYVSRAFGDYDPLALRDNDKPYDLDHISPQSHSLKKGRHRTAWQKSFVDVEDKVFARFHDYAWATTHAIGNYRVLSLDHNRSDGAKSVEEKMAGPTEDNNEKETSLHGQGVVDTVMPPGWQADWKAAGPAKNPAHWNEDRICAFQRAVERRAEHLYHLFYRDLDFDAWTRDEEGLNPDVASLHAESAERFRSAYQELAK